MPSSNCFLGIDYGQCYSSMAWYNPATGQAEVLANAEGEAQTRSIVYYGAEEPVVGTPAEEFLGDERTEMLVYPPGAKGEIAKRKVQFFGKVKITPLDVAVAVLRKLKRDAEKSHFREVVTQAIITVPATFDPAEREKLAEAGRLAGFAEVELVDEPVAAGLACAREGLAVGRTLLVCDLGAGKCELALLKYDPDAGTFSPAAPPRGVRKGGDDFDRALYLQLEDMVRKDNRDLVLMAKTNLHFLRECRDRKEELSARTSVTFSSVLPDGSPFQHKLDRPSFERLIDKMVVSFVEQTEQILRDASDKGLEIHAIVVHGGSARIPVLTELLERKFPNKAEKLQPAENAVARGAAYYAAARWFPDYNPIVEPKPLPTLPPEPIYASSLDSPLPETAFPFQFRSGSIAHNLGELIVLCGRHKEDAKWHLTKGHFESWLRDEGHIDLARKAVEVNTLPEEPEQRLLTFLRQCGESGQRVARLIETGKEEEDKPEVVEAEAQVAGDSGKTETAAQGFERNFEFLRGKKKPIERRSLFAQLITALIVVIPTGFALVKYYQSRNRPPSTAPRKRRGDTRRAPSTSLIR